jgi:hypothetical protein
MLDSAIVEINAMAGQLLLFRERSIRRRPARMIRVQWGSAAANEIGRTHLSLRDCALPCEHPWQIQSASISLASSAGMTALEHELLHALGLGHSCLAPSLMATEQSEQELRRCGERRFELGYRQGFVLDRILSNYDIAAVQILAALSAATNADSTGSIHLLTEHYE